MHPSGPIFVIILYTFCFNNAQDNICIINGKKSLNTVSEQFLGISVDPALILSPQSAFKNTSASTSLKLARYLAPGFLRISGPSTEFLKLKDANASSVKSLTITPNEWKSFNTWIKRSHLTPIFAVNDKFTGQTNDFWDPKALAPLLKINDDLNFPCYWQIGYDCNYKTLSQYKDDLQSFRSFLDSYPTRQLYKVVGSNLHSCLAHRSPELVGKFIDELEYSADAVIWESENAKSTPFLTTTYMPIWLTIPKDSNPVTFMSSLQWAKQIGDAAKAGYKVVFRQPRVHELHLDTPVYWVSLLYKTLMGQTVLDVTSNIRQHQNTYVYAHCAKNQQPNQGEIAVLIINNGADQYTTFVRLASSSQPKIVEIETYILTSEKGDSRDIYLNEAKLTMSDLRDYPYKPVPKIRRVKVDKLLSLSVPAKSIGFFVLLAAKVKVCINVANENILLSKEIPLQQTENLKQGNLQELFESINKEIREDEKFYKKDDETQTRTIHEKTRPYIFKPNNRILKEIKLRRNYLNKFKLPVAQPKLEIVFTERPLNTNDDKRKVELQLSKAEIKKILTDRAKRVIARNNSLVNSSEVENVMSDASRTLMNRQKRNKLLRFKSPMNWATTFRNKTRGPLINRIRRDINLDLLRYRDEEYPYGRTNKNRPGKKYFHRTEVEDFDSVYQPLDEESFDSREFDYNPIPKQRKAYQNVNDRDERIRFLSEADAVSYSRIPRGINGQMKVINTFRNESLWQRLKAKKSKPINKTRANITKDRILTHIKERKKNQIDKLKRMQQENKQKLQRSKGNKQAVQRSKRMVSNEYLPNVPVINGIQRYSREENLQVKPWKQQDLLKIKKAASYSVENIDSNEFLQIPVLKNHTNINNQHKRDTREEVLEENGIEYPFNNIYKEDEFYQENEDLNNGLTTIVISTTAESTTAKQITDTPDLLRNNFIDITSNTKTNKNNENKQQTKITINEDSIANMIMSVTGTLIQSIAEKIASIFP